MKRSAEAIPTCLNCPCPVGFHDSTGRCTTPKCGCEVLKNSNPGWRMSSLGDDVPRSASATAWEWDGYCVRCHHGVSLVENSDPPETEEDALCNSCVWDELHERRRSASAPRAEDDPVWDRLNEIARKVEGIGGDILAQRSSNPQPECIACAIAESALRRILDRAEDTIVAAIADDALHQRELHGSAPCARPDECSVCYGTGAHPTDEECCMGCNGTGRSPESG